MIIGIDCDNVLNNLTEELIKLYNVDANDSLILSDIKRYRIDDFVIPEYKDKIKDYFLDKKVWKNITVSHGSQLYIKKLIEDGHRILIVTATEPRNFFKKEGWLQRNFPEIDLRHDLICIKNKQFLKIDLLIDDYHKNLSDLKDHHGNLITADYIKICYAYPWNECFEVDNNTKFRCNSWEEIYSVIKKLNKPSRKDDNS